MFDTSNVFISIVMVVPQAEETSKQTTYIDVFSMRIKQRDMPLIKQNLAVYIYREAISIRSYVIKATRSDRTYLW